MSLHDAVRAAKIDEVKALIVTGSNINEIDKLKRTPLHLAAWAGNFEILQLLLRTNAQVNDKAMDGFLPLHFAAQSQSSEAAACVRSLIKKGKNTLNQRISKGNKSALHLAAIKGNEDVCLALIDLGADVAATTSSGQTVFDVAKTEVLREALKKHVSLMGAKKSATDTADEESETQTEQLVTESHPAAEVETGSKSVAESVESVTAAPVLAETVETTAGKKRSISEVESS